MLFSLGQLFFKFRFLSDPSAHIEWSPNSVALFERTLTQARARNFQKSHFGSTRFCNSLAPTQDVKLNDTGKAPLGLRLVFFLQSIGLGRTAMQMLKLSSIHSGRSGENRKAFQFGKLIAEHLGVAYEVGLNLGPSIW